MLRKSYLPTTYGGNLKVARELSQNLLGQRDEGQSSHLMSEHSCQFYCKVPTLHHPWKHEKRKGKYVKLLTHHYQSLTVSETWSGSEYCDSTWTECESIAGYPPQSLPELKQACLEKIFRNHCITPRMRGHWKSLVSCLRDTAKLILHSCFPFPLECCSSNLCTAGIFHGIFTFRVISIQFLCPILPLNHTLRSQE